MRNDFMIVEKEIQSFTIDLIKCFSIIINTNNINTIQVIAKFSILFRVKLKS